MAASRTVHRRFKCGIDMTTSSGSRLAVARNSAR